MAVMLEKLVALGSTKRRSRQRPPALSNEGRSARIAGCRAVPTNSPSPWSKASYGMRVVELRWRRRRRGQIIDGAGTGVLKVRHRVLIVSAAVTHALRAGSSGAAVAADFGERCAPCCGHGTIPGRVGAPVRIANAVTQETLEPVTPFFARVASLPSSHRRHTELLDRFERRQRPRLGCQSPHGSAESENPGRALPLKRPQLAIPERPLAASRMGRMRPRL